MINWDYEREEREMLLSLAKDGDIFYDIGANEGLYSISFAQRFPNSWIYAFEPIPDTITQLQSSIILSGVRNVALVPYGLTDMGTIALFYVSPDDSGASSMAPLEENRFASPCVLERPTFTLDYFVGYGSLPPDIIKCDVEGAELLVFKGGAKVLEKHKPLIQCEMLRKWAKRFNYHPNDIIAFLSQFGYHCFSLQNGKLERFETMAEDTKETNFYFVPGERL
jgi:FkbM family methyltransferase